MSRALGAWLRQERQARGWDVPEMAHRLRRAATSIDGTLPSKDILIAQVRRWERGRVGVSERYKLLYCKAFEITPAEFFGPAIACALVPAPRRQHADPCIDPAYAETVRRNEFLKLTSATLASLLGPPLVHGWHERYIPPRPELCEMLLSQFQAQTEGFRWLDRQRGSRSLLQATTTHARELTRLWRMADPVHPLREELGQIAADACHLVAYQMFDQGKRVQAIEWYRCSAELAAQARTQDLYVFAMCGVAYMHSLNGNGDLAMSVLDQLAALLLPMTAQCYIAVYQAHAYASLREHKPALLALDEAAVLSAKLHDEPPSPWLGMPDEAFVQRQRAMIAAKLGSAEALGLLDLLDESTPEVFQRYRVTLLADQALMHASLGHVEQAAVLLASAAKRNQRIRSAEKAARILRVRAVLNQHSDSSVLSDLDQALESSGAFSPGRRATGQ